MDNIEKTENDSEEIVRVTVEEIKNEDELKENSDILAKELKKEDRKKFFFGLGLIVFALAVIIAVVTIILINKNNDESGGVSLIVDDEEISVGENTELTGGSVTTTIGGQSVTYRAAYVVDGITATISSGDFASNSDDEVVFLVINGGTLNIGGEVTISKNGSDGSQGRGDKYSFYGLNSAVVVVGEGSSVLIKGAKVVTNASGANAVVATSGGKATVQNVDILTTKDNSRGLHATYAGEIIAENVSIATKGGSCAALATDRGEGIVTANRMNLSTEGAGSPLIYSTGTITVYNSNGTASGAQIAVVEGKNSISLSDCDFSANGNGNRDDVDNAGVMIYQSMSGDANVGEGSFVAEDCKFTILKESDVYMVTPMFFVTNTSATIKLSNVRADFYEDGYFLLAKGTEEWGKSGKNGGNVKLETLGLEATNANIGVDEISSVESL